MSETTITKNPRRSTSRARPGKVESTAKGLAEVPAPLIETRPASDTSIPDGGATNPGHVIARYRNKKGMTLTELARISGVSISTISRIENDRISPTYSVLSRLAQALKIRWPDMVGGKESSFAQGCRAVSRAGQGITHPTATGVYLWLGTDLVTKMMEPTLIDALADTGKHVLAGHDGEEFIYVTEGKLVFLMRDYAPLSLDVGDSIYFDAATPHACYGLTEPARYLSIVARPRN